jgi:chromosome segregation ATPase
MKTFMLYLSGFLLVCAYIFSLQYIERGKKIKLLETEKNELSVQVKSMEKEIERYNEKQLQASSTIEKVREVIKHVKEPCDCYHTSLPSDIKRLLHENNS